MMKLVVCFIFFLIFFFSSNLNFPYLDGTTSSVLFTGELLKQAERYTSEGLHPRTLTEGYEIARDMVIEYLDAFKVPRPDIINDRETLFNVARTALRTKLSVDIADKMADAVVDAVLSILNKNKEGQRLDPTSSLDLDLHMIEIMEMLHKKASDSTFVNGIVLDHGTRHPDMPTSLKNVRILTCNVSMEYEKTEINSSFFYSNAEQREKFADSENKFTIEKVKQVIDFKRKVCKEGESFAVINQKGIDPIALDMLAKEGIMALRRAKRRNMERLTLACGGEPVNSFDDLESEDILGYAGRIYEETLGDDKFTFVEDVKVGKSCTILVKGPNKHTIDQIKDAIRDGLRAIKNAIEDHGLIPGAGAFEIAASRMLLRRMHAVSGKAKLGVEAFAKSLLIIPKTLAENSGLDIMDSVLKVEEEQERENKHVGLNLVTGDVMLPETEGVWDNYIVKKQSISLATVLATQLLLVDEVMKAGKAMGKQPSPMDEE